MSARILFFTSANLVHCAYAAIALLDFQLPIAITILPKIQGLVRPINLDDHMFIMPSSSCTFDCRQTLKTPMHQLTCHIWYLLPPILSDNNAPWIGPYRPLGHWDGTKQ